MRNVPDVVFVAPESKAFVPIFRKVGAEVSLPPIVQVANDRLFHQLTAQWMDIIASSVDQSAVLNVASWLSRATMDSIGEGFISIVSPSKKYECLT